MAIKRKKKDKLNNRKRIILKAFKWKGLIFFKGRVTDL